MSINATVFEVRVEIKGDSPIRWHPWKDGAEYDKLLKTLHIRRRTPKQAKCEASKYGKVLSCRKLDVAIIAGDIEKLPLDNHKYVNVNPYSNAVAMDELIWKKRKTRRKNIQKDKSPIDK